MSRSRKKQMYIDPNLQEKVVKAKAEKSRKSIRTWSRASTISPDMVGMNFDVHNGRGFLPVFVTDSMVGHKLGEFAFTRKFTGHSKKGKIAKVSGSTGRAEAE